MALRAQAPPESSEARDAPHDAGLSNQPNKHLDCELGVAEPATLELERERVAQADKRVSTMRAAAALAGWVTHVTGVGEFAFVRWGRSHVVNGIEAAEA